MAAARIEVASSRAAGIAVSSAHAAVSTATTAITSVPSLRIETSLVARPHDPDQVTRGECDGERDTRGRRHRLLERTASLRTYERDQVPGLASRASQLPRVGSTPSGLYRVGGSFTTGPGVVKVQGRGGTQRPKLHDIAMAQSLLPAA